tara:strand:- start:61 stop:438 length:378 start_codon:yes stop_codon:yes gene_type:complete
VDNILNKQQMDKEQLENRIKELTVLIEEASGNVKNLVDEQAAFTKRLDDLNKPKLSHAQMDEVQHIVESACEVFELDVNDCEYELEIDYDNRIQINHFDWSRCQEELTQHIMDRLEEVFAVAEEE